MPTDTPLASGTSEGGSRTLALTMMCEEMLTPVRLRSYSSREHDATNECTVIQAALASVAFPNEFPSVRLGSANLPHMSAITGYSNPASEALDEAGRIWQVDAIECLISLGTGLPDAVSLGPDSLIGFGMCSALAAIGLSSLPKLLSFTKVLVENAMDGERCHDLVSKMAYLQSISYTRFNVPTGLRNISHLAADKDSIGKIRHLTDKYLETQTTKAQLDVCSMAAGSRSLGVRPSLDQTITSVQGLFRKYPTLVDIVLIRDIDGLPSPLEDPHGEDPTIAIPLRPPILLDAPRIRQDQDGPGAEAAEQWFENFDTVHKVMQRKRREDDDIIKIAILDSGIGTALKSAIGGDIEVMDWTGSPNGVEDSIGHGTHAAGIIHQIAPQAQLHIAKVFDSIEGDEHTNELIERAIRHAIEEWQVNIISMSFVFREWDTQVEAAIQVAHSKNIIMLAAASNSGRNEAGRPAYPADFCHVFKIHSSNGNGARSDWSPDPSPSDDNFSTVGEAVRFKWPGPDNRFSERKSGTSVATPVAAGIAALILEYANQAPCSISNRDSLRYYRGMRTIFNLMARENWIPGTYHYLRPWAIFDTTWSTSEISSIIQVELMKQGFVARSI